MPTLYVVATPIGNLEDITLRAIRVLGEVGLIAAEDTRKTRLLLKRHGIKTPVTSYHRDNEKAKLGYILSRLADHDVALVSEAGTPGLNDPGYRLIVSAIERGIQVIPVPGASVVVTALAVSGLPTDQFTYLGFLPRRSGERRRFLESVAAEPRTLVALEAPHRLAASLADIAQVLGDRRIAVCRELTKLHEEIFRGTVRQAQQHFTQPRGEFTLVIEGVHAPTKSDSDIEAELRRLRERGLSGREAASQVARAHGLPRRRVYQLWLKIARTPSGG